MENRINNGKYTVAGYLLVGWVVVFIGWWLFALLPLPQTSPEWVEAARRVCFGSLPNGLPEGYGWLTLLCSPMLMLTALVVIWPKELLEDFNRARNSSLGRVWLVGLIALPSLALGWGVVRVAEVQLAFQQAVEPNFSQDELPEFYPAYGAPAPKFHLIDQHGAEVSIDSFQGRPFILTFAFAHCATICPGLVQTIRQAADTYPGPRPLVVIVTLDPWRDTPGALPGLAKQWQLGADDYVLSGPVDDVVSVAEAYEVPALRNEQNGDIVHPGMAFVFDADGKLVYRFNDPPISWIHQALDRISLARVGQR